jgi:hypothetical protein
MARMSQNLYHRCARRGAFAVAAAEQSAIDGVE